MSGNPYSEACYAAADKLEEVNDTFETVIDWLSEGQDMGEAEEEIWDDHQSVYDNAENFRVTIYRKLKNSEIDELPDHMALVEEQIGRAKDLMDRYREQKTEESI